MTSKNIVRVDVRDGDANKAARMSFGGYENRNLFVWISISELLLSGIVVGDAASDMLGSTLHPSTRSPFSPSTTRNACSLQMVINYV